MTQPVVLITGCSSGIGRALADAFQAGGYQVWATARKPEDLATLEAAGFMPVELDVNDTPAVRALAEDLRRRARRLDGLINNAGYGAMGPLLDGGAEALRWQFDTNVFAPVELTRACFELLRASQGLVINIGSVSGVLVTPFAGAYCASKAALHALCEALRLELAPFGIQVMEVQPGAIALVADARRHPRPRAGLAGQADTGRRVRPWRAGRRPGASAQAHSAPGQWQPHPAAAGLSPGRPAGSPPAQALRPAFAVLSAAALRSSAP